jgi:hypothetical protein
MRAQTAITAYSAAPAEPARQRWQVVGEQAVDDVPVGRGQAARLDGDPDLTGSRLRGGHVAEHDHVRRPEPVELKSPHGATPPDNSICCHRP